jgi:plasmid stability protein
MQLGVQAAGAYTAYMQYTLRNIPEAVDAALRRRARQEGKSLNDVALEALSESVGLGPRTVRRRDLRKLAGTWKPDKEFLKALADQDRIDPEMWK